MDLPGLRSPTVRSRLEASRVEKRAPDRTQLPGGETLSGLAALNVTVDGGLRDSQRRWYWSSGDAKAPQQQRGSDSGLMTVLCVIHQARGWDMQALGALDPRAMRGWFLMI